MSDKALTLTDGQRFDTLMLQYQTAIDALKHEIGMAKDRYLILSTLNTALLGGQAFFTKSTVTTSTGAQSTVTQSTGVESWMLPGVGLVLSVLWAVSLFHSVNWIEHFREKSANLEKALPIDPGYSLFADAPDTGKVTWVFVSVPVIFFFVWLWLLSGVVR